MRNMKLMPEATPHPCPRCGGTYWASKPPETEQDQPRSTKFIIAVFAVILATVLAVVMSHAQTVTFRDASGRLTGTSSRDANGTVTYRDGSGRMTGTSTRDGNSTRTLRDGSGRMLGTETRR